jgi:DNA-binding ferritin-like protein
MAYIFFQGALEPEQVQESVDEAAEAINKSGSSAFGVFRDYSGEICIVNLLNVNVIKETI